MNCEQIQPILLDYLLEEVEAEARGAIAQHLEDCEACSEEVGRLRRTLALLARGEVREEVPQGLRLVAEPVGSWKAFWRSGARLAFAGAGLACLAIALLALFRATLLYQDGNFEIAFGVEAVTASQARRAATTPVWLGSQPLSRADVMRWITEAVSESELRQRQTFSSQMRTLSEEVDHKRVRDLREIAESIRYFQAAQTMMWKEQVQNQYVMGNLMRQVGLEQPPQP